MSTIFEKIHCIESSLSEIKSMLQDNESDCECSSNRLTFAKMGSAMCDGRIFKVGEVITTPNKLYGDIDWVVIRGNSNRNASVVINTLHPITYCQFDSPCKKYPYGHNDWESSYIRSMLHQEFLQSFAEEDQNSIIETQKITYRNAIDGGGKVVTNDKFFLLSASEVGFTGDNIKDEGFVYEYFKDQDNRAKTDADDGAESYWWLRSPYPSNAHYVRGVIPSGELYNYDASSGNGAAPACVIGAKSK